MFEINFQTGQTFFRFKLNFKILKLYFRFQINSNGFSRDRSFGHKSKNKNLAHQSGFQKVWKILLSMLNIIIRGTRQLKIIEG